MRRQLSLIALLAGCAPASSDDPGRLPPHDIQAGDIHIVGTSDSIAEVVDLMPGNDGSVWMLNNAVPFLVQLSSEGTELTAHGVSGGGPGEFSWPSTLVRTPSTGDIHAFDAGVGSLISVDLEDRFNFPRGPSGAFRLNSYEWLWMNNGGRTWLRGVGDSLIFARPTNSGPWMHSFWTSEVVRVATDGSEEVLVSTASIVGDSSSRFGGAQRFLPYPLWAACPDGSLAAYDPNRNLIHRFNSDGEPQGTHDLPAERQERVTVDRVFSTVYPGVIRNRLVQETPERDNFYALVKRDYENRADEFASVFPEYVHLDCAPGSTLWLQLFDTSNGDMGRGPAWLRIAEDGTRGEVRFPVSFRPMRFHEGRIWGVSRDDLDVAYAAWTELPVE